MQPDKVKWRIFVTNFIEKFLWHRCERRIKQHNDLALQYWYTSFKHTSFYLYRFHNFILSFFFQILLCMKVYLWGGVEDVVRHTNLRNKHFEFSNHLEN